MRNAFSVDLEEGFCSHNFDQRSHHSEWALYESRVEPSTHLLLSLFEKYNVRATFFVLGWVAERHPDLIRTIASRGHEIASHGYGHTLLTYSTPDEFRRDLDHALMVTQSLVTEPIIGYRAPAFSLTPGTTWAIPILKEFHFQYDSSVFPLRYHPDYGFPTAPLTFYRHTPELLEVPLTCATFGHARLPCSGGAYFRLFPYPLFRQLIRICHRQGRPVIFYIHPWELDPEQPRMPAPLHARIRHYTNLSRTESRLRRLLHDFEFTSIGELLVECDVKNIRPKTD